MAELMKLLEGFDCAEVGFGADTSVKASIDKAVFECPFISSGLKGLNGVVVCNLASVTLMSKSGLHSFVSTFHQTTRCTCELVVSFIHEPDQKDNVILTTILVMRRALYKISYLPEISGLNQDVAIGNHVNGKILEEKEEEELQDLLSDYYAGPRSMRNRYQEDQRGGFELPQSDDETFTRKTKTVLGLFSRGRHSRVGILAQDSGWFYFHTGDRWFANLWKGKTSGEARFYSKSGDIFFGHFQDGWRHGQCLYIDNDGTRWNQGVLTSRNKLTRKLIGDTE